MEPRVILVPPRNTKDAIILRTWTEPHHPPARPITAGAPRADGNQTRTCSACAVEKWIGSLADVSTNGSALNSSPRHLGSIFLDECSGGLNLSLIVCPTLARSHRVLPGHLCQLRRRCLVQAFHRRPRRWEGPGRFSPPGAGRRFEGPGSYREQAARHLRRHSFIRSVDVSSRA